MCVAPLCPGCPARDQGQSVFIVTLTDRMSFDGSLGAYSQWYGLIVPFLYRFVPGFRHVTQMR